MSYFGGCCYYIIGICEHFDFAVHATKNIGKKENHRKREEKGYNEIKNHLFGIVNLHNKLFE